MKKFILMLGATLLLAVGYSCSDDKNEPDVPKEPTEEKPAEPTDSEEPPVEDEEKPGDDEQKPEDWPKVPEVTPLTAEEFEEIVANKYWYEQEVQPYHPTGEIWIDEVGVCGNYGMLAFYVDTENGIFRDYTAFINRCYKSKETKYDPETGWLTSPSSGKGPYRIHKYENGKLYMSHNYDKTAHILVGDDVELEKGSYTYGTYVLASPQQISYLEGFNGH